MNRDNCALCDPELVRGTIAVIGLLVLCILAVAGVLTN